MIAMFAKQGGFEAGVESFVPLLHLMCQIIIQAHLFFYPLPEDEEGIPPPRELTTRVASRRKCRVCWKMSAILSYLELPLTMWMTVSHLHLFRVDMLWKCAFLYLCKECYCMSVCLHRYFSHKAFRCGRGTQFALSFAGCLASQGSPIWWASKHRRHHKYCDTDRDPHSPQAFSKLYAWIGWIYVEGPMWKGVDSEFVADLQSFPELRVFELAPWLPVSCVHWAWYSAFGMGELVFVSMWSSILCQLLTLYFNVLFHDNEAEGTCKASDLPHDPLSNLFGEAYHRDHHAHPAKCKRPGLDVPYWTCIKPLKQMGVFY